MIDTVTEVSQLKHGSASSPFGGNEADTDTWANKYPAAHHVYWNIRAVMADRDGESKEHHHRIAVLAVHRSFRKVADRKRLGLPPTEKDLSELLGVTPRTLRAYREKYPDVFSTAQTTIREAFIGAYYGDVYEALGTMASTPSPKMSADRRLFLQVAGDLTDKSKVDLTTGGDKLPTDNTAAIMVTAVTRALDKIYTDTDTDTDD